jgi:acyl-CoA synthetase (NDP forming)
VLEEATRRRIGLSSFVSMGNKADVSGNDLLRYWAQDPDTDVILLYLESFGNPRQFARIARQASLKKPIVAVKAGRTTSGQRAASSHTAALASPDAAVDALFAHAGVIRVDTLEDLLGVAQVVGSQPIPSGSRVAIVGNAGGPGILAADACEAVGLQVPRLSTRTQTALRSFLPAAAAVTNPVDMVASASAEDYQRTLRLILADEEVDAVVAIFVPPLVTDADDVARAIAGVASEATKPLVASFVGMASSPEPLTDSAAHVPNFAFPESAVRALARACEYGQWRRRPSGDAVVFHDVDLESARRTVRGTLDKHPDGAWLMAADANRLLDAYRIPRAECQAVRTPSDAVQAAAIIGYPVALKAGAAGLLHKTEKGAVRVALKSPSEVEQAYAEMSLGLGESMGGALVQAMADPGVEVIVGVVHDASFGPLLMYGTGGTTVELFGDRSLRVLPITDADSADLVRSVRGSALLFGFRGSPAVDVAALENVILRVAQLAQDHPEIAEMDLNPVVVGRQGAVAVDAKIRIAPCEPEPDPTIRQLG